MLHLCKDKDYAVPALASAYTLAVSQAAKRFRVRGLAAPAFSADFMPSSLLLAISRAVKDHWRT